jgi:hypothetical protein
VKRTPASQPTPAPPRCHVCERILTRLRCEMGLPADKQKEAPQRFNLVLHCISGVIEGQIALLDTNVENTERDYSRIVHCFYEQIFLLEQCREWLASARGAAGALDSLIPRERAQ